MRYNKQELLTLATQPSQKFDKEGILLLRERQEGFFRRTEISLERWCRLRGNLLFYFKSRDQWSEPLGVIVLQQCSIKLDPPSPTPLPDGPYGFSLVFDGGLAQHVAALTEQDRDQWLDAIQLSSYDCMRAHLLSLQQRLETRRGQDPDLDVQMWRLRRNHTLDPCELPLCEVSLSCDNLLCDGHGRPPNPVLLVHVYIPEERVLLKYAKTEVIERSSNPSFLNTVSFRASDGLNSNSKVRLTAYDVREPVSQTATPLGSACITLGTLQDCERLRIPLKSCTGSTVGFLSVFVWALEREDHSTPSTESTPCRTAHVDPALIHCHRRSQSLPPRLNSKLKLPHQGQLRLLFANPTVQTYRFHSGLGGDISVHEVMAESRLCFTFPQQLLGVWIQEEKELLQEVAGMGELVEPWHSKQVQLLDRHLHLLHLYSQASENLAAHKGGFFKPSSRKNDRSLEFAPVNLHLQRMWVQNDTLKKCDFYDVVTVGAFTAHSHKNKNGGLIKLLQQLKESPIKANNNSTPGLDKITMAFDAIQAIKQLRREVVEAMRSLMRLAKEKQTLGMLPICEDMISKTRILLTLWDPGLVEEALSFVEKHKMSLTDDLGSGGSGGEDSLTLSPFRRITQQLSFNELKSPDYDELVTPDSPRCLKALWELQPKSGNRSRESSEHQFVIFPDAEEEGEGEREVEGKITEGDGETEDDDSSLPSMSNGFDSDVGRRFLDTHAMSSSPSANYYKPTDEPEPWDLTQLNIEASVMCLVSKVKFLCGRCGSPAVRLRSQRGIGRSKSFRSELSSQSQQEVVTSQPTSVTVSGVVVGGRTGGPKRTNSDDAINKAVDCANVVRNKFTEGLDFSTITDWTTELRPSMRKLRQAMDGLLKTARLTHSVFRVQEDRRTAQKACNVRYRRHVCFSQALTALVTALMAKLWCQKPDPVFLLVLTTIGPLVSFEGLLSYYGDEVDMWGDMVVAVEDLQTVGFTMARCPPNTRQEQAVPKVTGSRSSLGVVLPVPDSVHSLLPLSSPPVSSVTFHVTPVFFNIGINEMATLAESLGATKPQERSNVDNFDRLNRYYHRFRKLNVPSEKRGVLHGPQQVSLDSLVDQLKGTVLASRSKNVEILHLSSRICRRMKGLRFTSCKSAKDRTGMSVTLEQCCILRSEYDLAEHEFSRALDCMRSEGCRRENTYKNVNVRKYAFNSLQILTLPKQYRPPAGTFGSAQS
ncbi:type II inositol 3,4-bisphosphate 4-phosphatase isoform X2 [Homalodisca vitripennis]|uniref:type II inositol 3,4-bisphosphate 4-phosphatase isoform X2 n=1 Tax=Homalodisca vitripennis TaxID=197043 RepID=UPI001EEAEE14|nr:type II inositol 3,4-bisphosphate 4-phosphatase isoform X2 [Homalodisca vitripennis]